MQRCVSQNSLIIKRISLDLFSWFRKSSSPIPTALQRKPSQILARLMGACAGAMAQWPGSTQRKPSQVLASQAGYAPASFFSAAIRCSCRCLCATTPRQNECRPSSPCLSEEWKLCGGVPVGAVVGGVRDDAADHLEESFAQLGCRRDVVQLTHLSTTADMTQACVNSSRDSLPT